MYALLLECSRCIVLINDIDTYCIDLYIDICIN